jgi:hypothetical protein
MPDAYEDANLTRASTFLKNARNGTNMLVYSNFRGFHSIQDVENELSCLGKLACVLDKTGDIKARDSVVREFCDLDTQG